MNKTLLNSPAPGRCGNSFKDIIFKLIIQSSNFGTYCEIVLKSMPLNTFDVPVLVWVMAWCRLANVDMDLWWYVASLGYSEMK